MYPKTPGGDGIPTVYMDVKGPASLAQVIAALAPSTPRPTDSSISMITFSAHGLKVTAEYERRSPWTYTVDIDGRPIDDIQLHAMAVRIVKQMLRKRWDVRVVPALNVLCSRERHCPVCNGANREWVHERSENEWRELAKDVAATADLDDPTRSEIDGRLGEDAPESIIAAVALGTRTPLPPYFIGRVRQLVALDIYPMDLGNRLINALDEQSSEGLGEQNHYSERQATGNSIANDLAAIVDLQSDDRESMKLDLEAGDFESAIFDGVLNARSRLPKSLIKRIQGTLELGWFGEFSTELADALHWHEEEHHSMMNLQMLLKDLNLTEASRQQQAEAIRDWLMLNEPGMRMVTSIRAEGFEYLLSPSFWR